MKLKTNKSIHFTLLLCSIFLFWGCDDSSSDDNDISQVSSPFLICASRNPGGVGIDLDSSTAYNLDDKSDFVWDIRIKTYKGVKSNSGTAALAGAPFIKLKGTSLTAYQWSTYGETNYNAITLSNIVEGSLAADSVEEIDIASVDVVVEADGLDSSLLGKMYYAWSGKTGLKQKYADLTIGEAWKTINSKAVQNHEHNDDPIYIIKSDDGNFFKLMITDFGPNSSIEKSGYIAIVWEKL
jgi:hypothetical protein